MPFGRSSGSPAPRPQGMPCALSSHSRAHMSHGPTLVTLMLTRGPGGNRPNPLMSSLTCSHAFAQSSSGNFSPSSFDFLLFLQLLFYPLSPSLEKKKRKKIMLIVVWLITTQKYITHKGLENWFYTLLNKIICSH